MTKLKPKTKLPDTQYTSQDKQKAIASLSRLNSLLDITPDEHPLMVRAQIKRLKKRVVTIG